MSRVFRARENWVLPRPSRYLEIGYRGSTGVRMGFIGNLFLGTSSECMGSVGIVGVIPWSSEDEGRSEKGLVMIMGTTDTV